MKRIKTSKKRLIFRKIRYVVGLLFLIILAFRLTLVEAGSNDSKIERNRVDGIYAVTKLNGVNRIFYLNMYTLNERIAYCIELGVDINSEIYNSTFDFNISNLSREKIEYIKNVSYFGYGYGEHNDIYYYMATQEIIWEYLDDIEIEWTNVLDINGERVNIDNYKNKIINLVNDYCEGIKLDGYDSNMVVSIGDEVIISDINNNLSYYDVLSSEHCDAVIEEGKLYLKFDTDYVGKEEIKLKRKQVYSYDSSLYYQGNSQKLISNGNVLDEIRLSFDIKGKKLSIQLRDSIDIKHNNQFDYLDTTFELYNSDKVFLGRIKSDKEGRIFVNNLPYGKYYARSVYENEAYLFNYIDHHFEFTSEDELVYIYLQPIISEISILKLYGEADNLLRESGISFDIFNIDGSLYDSFTTNDDGIGSIKVPYGEYVIKQKNSSYGYDMVDDIYVDCRKYSKNPIVYTLVDELILSNLVVNVKDINNSKIVEDGISYKVKKDGEYLIIDGVSEFKSIDGVMVLPNKIGYGEYVIEVINNSSNYFIEDKKISFVIDDNSNFKLVDGELYFELDVIGDLVDSEVQVKAFRENIKYNDNTYYYDYVKDAGLELSLVAFEDIVVNNQIIYMSGQVIGNIITDRNGEYLIENIYLGEYCLVDGSDNRECFEVIDDNKLVVEFKSNLNKGKVKVHNISSEMDDIMGTVMEFKNDKGDIVYIGSTNEYGIITIDNLVYGKYCFSQRSVDNNYLINKDKICFLLNDELVNLEVVNKKAGKKIIMIPDTFSDKNSIKKLIILSLILVGGVIYKVKIRSKFN